MVRFENPALVSHFFQTISLIATRSPVVTFSPLYTWPYWPLPISLLCDFLYTPQTQDLEGEEIGGLVVFARGLDGDGDVIRYSRPKRHSPQLPALPPFARQPQPATTQAALPGGCRHSSSAEEDKAGGAGPQGRQRDWIFDLIIQRHARTASKQTEKGSLQAWADPFDRHQTHHRPPQLSSPERPPS